MPTCKICLRKFQKLRYRSPRICICGHCTNSLNDYREVAEYSFKSIGDLLKTGMLKNAHADSSPGAPKWRQERGQKILANFDVEFKAALPLWTNKLLANPENRSKEFKIARAYRRGLLHFDRPIGWGYPNNWREVSANIRALDGYSCISCGAVNTELHVHHVVYVSNFGTHQKNNLVTLCRRCHEEEHETVFDFGEDLLSPESLPANY
ncbi:MAG: HNH endonuclease [Lysobacter sp.]|nr:MAG: HNH endonuclease [Lysobacter sp.]